VVQASVSISSVSMAEALPTPMPSFAARFFPAISAAFSVICFKGDFAPASRFGLR